MFLQRQAVLLATITGAHLVACGGSQAEKTNTPSSSNQEQSTARTVAVDHADAYVTSIDITPMEEEEVGGGMAVTIRDPESVSHWVNSEAFSSTGWQTNADKLPARYRVVFMSEDGEVARFYLGTVKGDPVKYRCFGLCATWWIAPANARGEQDSDRYRVMEDTIWHPLAREWYLSSK
jgi:hypothetical protein